MIGKSRWISKSKFENLSIGEEVVILYMIGNAQVASKHYIESRLQHVCVDIKFNSGPWNGKTLPIPRRQISNLGMSFPANYKKK